MIYDTGGDGWIIKAGVARGTEVALFINTGINHDRYKNNAEIILKSGEVALRDKALIGSQAAKIVFGVGSKYS